MNQLDRLGEPVYALFRMVVGFLFMTHGVASLFGLFGGHRGSGQALQFAVWPNWWAALIQLVCGALVLGGLFTRAGAILASGSMAYAYFIVHQPQDLLPLLNGGELAAVFCWSFLLVAVMGPGVWSLDSIVHRHQNHELTPDTGGLASVNQPPRL
ncbi:DoxX family protein [Sphaerisporangium sp. TRM90804]|uniref:DoxX family protein n=1 Tax=Sphaerisporangium sp. TRM90804 TaxID=3031113 RepID=UPI0024488406|nr:DoxX family protein [Sphaerisporangium sp. TRM90804]MDH2425819.1 DoxX family protein [Sphaerisporangium sp. TRM90804]